MEVQDNLFPKLLLVAGAELAAPATGLVAIYAKVDGKIYGKNAAGTEMLLAASDLTAIMAMLTAAVTHNFTADVNYSLTTADANSSVLKVTDTPTVLTLGRDLIFPGAFSPKLFTNATAQILTVKKAGQPGTAVAAGATVLVYSGATDVLVFSAAAGGAVTSVNGQTGAVIGVTSGKHAIPIMAAAMTPSVTGGCAALATIASAADQPDIQSLDFDATTQEYAQFAVPMPKSWNEGTITFQPRWSHAATTTNFNVAWSLQAVAVSNDDPIAASYGAAVQVNDIGGTTSDLYIGDESAAITIAGIPQAGDTVYFRVARGATDATNDTLAIDARLHSIVVFITTDADNDA